LKGLKIACAGRLDPMAEGVLIVMAGEALKDYDKYCRRDKAYEAEALLGFSSDSWDVMGMMKKVETGRDLSVQEIKHELKKFVGKVELPLPPYSSPTVEGKPLYWWAKRGKLTPENLPVREMEIFSIQCKGMKELGAGEALQSVTERIQRVEGDFRKDGIIARWSEILAHKDEPLQIVSFRVHCASGTYIRSIAHAFGARLGCGALLYRLVRTRVGRYGIAESERALLDRVNEVY